MFRKIYISILGAVVAAVPGIFAQPPQVEARIAGLEANEEYMSLLGEDARLQIREDSIAQIVSRMRRQLQDDPANRRHYSQEILELEGRMFEIRNAKGRLIDRINTIEQEWVLANLSGAVHSGKPAEQDAAAAVPDSLKVRNLVDNIYLRDHLTPEDYAALRKAQGLEMGAVDYVNRYFANHATLAALAENYEAVQTEAEATEILDRYEALQGLNRVLADSLSLTWHYIFDNKNYAYARLLDKLGEERILSREEELAADAARQLSDLREEVASEAVADYFLRKRVLVDFESEVARVLDLGQALDSLRGVKTQLEAVDFRLPRVAVTERFFLEYDSVAFSSVPKYTYQHPIPECKVYSRGTIYRVLLGTFNTKRAAATFRGAYPLFYLIDDAGKWCYYTGGFATREEADRAQALLKKHGFVRPEVVVWTDGEYRNLAHEPEAEPGVACRIEISGTDTLSDAAKAIAAAGDSELSRVGEGRFVVGTFASRSAAEQTASALRAVEPDLEIKVVEIVE